MRINDINLLSDEFRPIALNIMNLVQFYNLPFRVFETLRTVERQEELVANKNKVTSTIHSKHIFGEAVDLVLYIDGKWSWKDKHLHYYKFLGALVKEEMGDKVIWGGDWTNLKDYVHYEQRKV